MNTQARTPKQLGNLIREARLKRGLTQAALGELASQRQGTISSVENGKGATRVETLLAILAALDLELHVSPRARDQTRLEDIF